MLHDPNAHCAPPTAWHSAYLSTWIVGVKPLINADSAIYLIGSKLKGTMSKKSKMAFAANDKAKAVQGKQGGELGSFDDALRETYPSLAHDTMMIRKRRADKSISCHSNIQCAASCC